MVEAVQVRRNEFDVHFMQSLARHVFQITEGEGGSALAEMITKHAKGEAVLKHTSDAWSRRHTASATARAQFSRPLIHRDDYSKAAYIRALNHLCPEYISIIRSKYHCDFNERERHRVGAQVWVMDAAREHKKNRTGPVRARIGQFAGVMLQTRHAIADPWELDIIGMSKDTWDKSSDKKYWHEARQHLWNLERQALEAWWHKIGEV